MRDLGRHLGYWRGGLPNPFRYNQAEGAINRNARHGFGMQHGNLQVYNGDTLFDITQMTWDFTMCGNARNEYHRREVYGRVAAHR